MKKWSGQVMHIFLSLLAHMGKMWYPLFYGTNSYNDVKTSLDELVQAIALQLQDQDAAIEKPTNWFPKMESSLGMTSGC